MKTKLLSAVVLCTVGLMGCGDDSDPAPTNNPPKLDSQQGIMTYVEGKRMVMEGANIPSHPNGVNEGLDFGAASQCYQKVTMSVQAGNFTVDSIPGTIEGGTQTTPGTCNKTLPKNALSFTSRNVLIENVAADGSCFNVVFTYPSFKQVGRGGFSADGKTLNLEIFFENAATGANCEAGPVGSKTINLVANGQSYPFPGNAVQKYVIQ
ncbi:hypothetical protein HPC49_11880 [Pyxidicoccus fallax]|uniref:Lipoprotein n=1 Tax=Pyxidicoccus fallax TaxID=394095 RepID=A0A848LFX9_9BACT|nr:hypothetical protein [Pyxidicoccus fallax]NMO17342.1 hypothetical protein [Pyxidicoccus fallax]NPC78939.1 hypothetical protein [Pyxidicoccus fallax]